MKEPKQPDPVQVLNALVQVTTACLLNLGSAHLAAMRRGPGSEASDEDVGHAHYAISTVAEAFAFRDGTAAAYKPILAALDAARDMLTKGPKITEQLASANDPTSN